MASVRGGRGLRKGEVELPKAGGEGRRKKGDEIEGRSLVTKSGPFLLNFLSLQVEGEEV